MEFKTKSIIPALTGLRAVAAWMIFGLHFFPMQNPAIPEFLKKIVSQWHIGVDIFFVLSGFLITYRYFGKKVNIKQYMVNRFARIYPMYFLITVGVFINFFIVNRYWDTEKTIEAVLSFTMTKALFDKYFLTAGISQGWTLTLEEMFYFTAPLYFVLIARKKIWLLILPVAIFLFGTFLKNATATPENTWGFMQENISVYIFEFFAGIFLAIILRNKNLPTYRFPIFTSIGILFLIFFPLIFSVSFGTNDFRMAAERIALSGLGIGPLLFGLITEKSLLSRFFSNRIMVLLGKSSYVFYLIHKGFIPVLIYDYIAENVAVIFILITGLSILMFKYIEEPLNLWIRKKYAK